GEVHAGAGAGGRQIEVRGAGARGGRRTGAEGAGKARQVPAVDTILGEPFPVEVRPPADRQRLADVADTVPVGVLLEGVPDERTIVAGVADQIAVGVHARQTLVDEPVAVVVETVAGLLPERVHG